jgi:hypothetical protein
MIIYKNHTEVSVANLVINLTTKYFFALKKKAPSLSLFINFFTKSLILNCNDSSTETSGAELHSLQFQANEDLFDSASFLAKNHINTI